MKLQRLYSLTRQAIDCYHLIEDGDRIAVGISGGKDSLTLLYALQGLKQFYPKHFELSAVTVDLGFEGFDLSPVKELCERFSVPYTVVSTEIGKILFDTRRESNPCSLCAKLRKGALNEAALKLGCNKIAYAHHREDLIETMLLSLIYEGRFYAFSPITHLDRTGLTVIRPMIYVKESDITGFKNKYNLPVCKNPCPVDGHTKREYVKNLTKILEQENPGVKDRLFHAIADGNIEGWPGQLTGGNKTDVNKTGVNKTDFNKTDFNKTDFNKTDFNKTDFNKTGVNKTDFNKTGTSKTDFNKTGTNKTGVNKTDFNKTGVSKKGGSNHEHTLLPPAERY